MKIFNVFLLFWFKSCEYVNDDECSWLLLENFGSIRCQIKYQSKYFKLVFHIFFDQCHCNPIIFAFVFFFCTKIPRKQNSFVNKQPKIEQHQVLENKCRFDLHSKSILNSNSSKNIDLKPAVIYQYTIATVWIFFLQYLLPVSKWKNLVGIKMKNNNEKWLECK